MYRICHIDFAISRGMTSLQFFIESQSWPSMKRRVCDDEFIWKECTESLFYLVDWCECHRIPLIIETTTPVECFTLIN